MEHYKLLNKELVEQLQILKAENATYRREIVHLREQLFEERSKNVAEKDAAIQLLTNTFVSALKIIQPDVRASKLFIENENFEGNIEASKTNSVSNGRHSAEILKELRRSSAIQQRRSIPVGSPVHRRSSQKALPCNDRRHSSDKYNEIEEESTCETINSSSENDEEAEDAENDVEVTTVKNDTLNEMQLGAIAEDDEFENSASYASSSSATDSPKIVIRRGKENRCNESIPAARFSLNADANETDGGALREQMYSEMTARRMGRLDSTSPTTPTIINFTMQNFENATCSTPRGSKGDNLNEQTKKKIKRRSIRLASQSPSNASNTYGTSTASDCTNSLSRPRRKCMPVSLKEPSLNAKLRNENKTAKKRHNKVAK